MRVEFKTADLARLETDPTCRSDLPPEVVRAFSRRMAVIRAAQDERDLYAITANRFKKLQGARAHQRSMRLNDQWRLILEVRESSPGNTILIVDIADYH